jgi:hypothetical protein
MRKLITICIFAGTFLFCATSAVSVRWSHGSGLAVSFATNSADAAELGVRNQRRTYRRAYYGPRYAVYDPYCSGPYVGGGWNGGTYYGGPWIDLGCFADPR